MMQALLEDRFSLRIHTETRQVPVYVLGVTKAGIRLPPAKVACISDYAELAGALPKKGQPLPPLCGRGTINKDGIEVRGSTMAQFCIALSSFPLRMERRKFMDKTGIAGRFDFDLKLPAYDLGTDGNAPGTPQTPIRPPDDFVRLQDALLKVGLQLTSAKGPDEFLVIDGAERPAAN